MIRKNTTHAFIIFPLLIIFLFSCSEPPKAPKQLTKEEKQKLRKLESWTYWYADNEKGHPFITNFTLPEGSDFLNQAIIQDDEQNMLLANRKGITVFDGKHQDIVQMKNIPLSLKKSSETNQIFIGCKGDFGTLTKDETGIYNFTSLFEDESQKSEYSEILMISDTVFFCSKKSIATLQVDEDSDSDFLYEIESKEDSLFAGFLKHQNKIFVNVSGIGLHKLESEKLKLLGDSGILASQEILFSFPFDEENTLLGTNTNNLYKFNGKEITAFSIKDIKYISESVLSGGANLSSSEFVLTTRTGGCVVISKDTGKSIVTVNYQNGLPDDEIFSITTDGNKGLWLAHGYGISRIDFSLPVKNYSIYPGIEGNLTAVTDYNNTVYVATTEGVFFLTKVTSYKDIGQYVRHKTSTYGHQSSFQAKWRATLKIWGAKTGKVSSGAKNYALQSFKFKFNKIPGLQGKCKQLVKYKDHLLVASNTGIYELTNKKTKPIVTGKYINVIIPSDKNGTFYIGANDGLFILSHHKNKWRLSPVSEEFNPPVYSIVQTNKQVWAGSDNKAYSFSLTDSSFQTYNFNALNYEQISVCEINQKPAFINTLGIYELHQKKLDIQKIDSLDFNNTTGYFSGSDGTTWFRTNEKWLTYKKITDLARKKTKFVNLFSPVTNIHIDDDQNAWVIAGNSLYKILSVDDNQIRDFNMYIKSASNITNNEVFELEDMSIAYSDNSVRFEIAAPFFANSQNTKYSYHLDGLSDDWSKWSGNSYLDFPYLPSGDYTLKVKAKNALGQISNTKELKFTIRKPFWDRWWFRIFFLGIIVYGIYKLIKIREEYLENENERLEGIIRERTSKIRKQKEEIEHQHAVVSEQKEKITASIGYARRIQNAVLPQTNYIKQFFPNHFILFKPQSIVSGDFYWLKESNGYITYAAADCTGHGVPGAFMSMLGISFLNDIVGSKQIDSAGEILNQLRAKVKQLLKQEDMKGKQKDGMDIALCVVDKQKRELQFSGAYNPLYIIRKNANIDELKKANGYRLLQKNDHTLIEVKADKQPIAVHIKETEFTTHHIKLQENDTLYSFSDGFIDQTRGGEDRKYMSKNFKELLLNISEKPLEEQKEILDETIESWKNGSEQLDDILVVGIRV